MPEECQNYSNHLQSSSSDHVCRACVEKSLRDVETDVKKNATGGGPRQLMTLLTDSKIVFMFLFFVFRLHRFVHVHLAQRTRRIELTVRRRCFNLLMRRAPSSIANEIIFVSHFMPCKVLYGEMTTQRQTLVSKYTRS